MGGFSEELSGESEVVLTGYWVLGAGCWVLGAGYGVLGAGAGVRWKKISIPNHSSYFQPIKYNYLFFFRAHYNQKSYLKNPEYQGKV